MAIYYIYLYLNVKICVYALYTNLEFWQICTKRDIHDVVELGEGETYCGYFTNFPDRLLPLFESTCLNLSLYKSIIYKCIFFFFAAMSLTMRYGEIVFADPMWMRQILYPIGRNFVWFPPPSLYNEMRAVLIMYLSCLFPTPKHPPSNPSTCTSLSGF